MSAVTGDFGVAEQLLTERGALSIEHAGGTLLAHLRRVRQLLADWGADHDVQLAGLCHAAYGTDGFGTALLDISERATLREVIGERAEELVYRYGSCDRKASYPGLGETSPVFTDRFTGELFAPSATQLQAFLEITAANELDVFRHNSDLAERYRGPLRRLLARAALHLSPAARAAWSIADGFDPTGEPQVTTVT